MVLGLHLLLGIPQMHSIRYIDVSKWAGSLNLLKAKTQGFSRSRSDLVDDIEHSILPSVMGAVLDEVVGPHVIAVLRPQPDA